MRVTTSHYLGELRGAQETWSGALRHWLEGRGLCQEAKRYVSNFMVVTRARPQEEEHGGENSDDLKSDEELELRTGDLALALETRIGGRKRREGPEGLAAAPAEDQEAREAFDTAEAIWAKREAAEGATELAGISMEDERLKTISESARASQKRETTERPKSSGEAADASMRRGKTYTAGEVRGWMAEVRARRDAHGHPAVKQAQLVMLQIVVDRVCTELEEAGQEEARRPATEESHFVGGLVFRSR